MASLYMAESMPLKGFAGAQGDSSKRPKNWQVSSVVSGFNQ